MEIKGKKILVVGLARTGVAVARFLASRGAKVTVTDMKEESELADYLLQLEDLDLNLELGRHDKHTFLMSDLIVVSPGVPMDISPLLMAKAQRRVVISEIELAAAFIKAPMVAITGTNGKTTTTTLAGEIFKACGVETFVGGNIGNPLIELVTSGNDVAQVVVELSSFQLEGIQRFRPKVAVLLNITEDHLDRYASYQDYIDAKLRIFENQTVDDFAVLNVDDPLVAACAATVKSRVFPFSQRKELAEGIFCSKGIIVYRWQGSELRFDTAAFKLKGVHNIENIMAALASTLLSGADPIKAGRAVESFKGLRHRMEFIREVGGVAYYEDSKGTNVGSVVKSLESFDKGITLIAGGKDKGGSYAPLADLVRERVKHLILIGEAKERIEAELGNLTDTHKAATLEDAVAIAHRLAKAGEVVLFSPACSSFDMFKDYAERAERFNAAVRALAGGDCR
ncbi:UDP-N-acetylmuramyl-L-alanine--D-glutamate ligase [Geotalea daltonii FRC-32]|uniref:UDP-N-acetylmuramoylalanine--D-glutamate ligase n=1 Tax=Geotalea daltonii (strain DSM 22248 / JCM 15807 / FRC-32) TaxID=316067 RepID=MURD_GEODF|nr:UDP-N-acetylmuramoyl-L-alanine--D-glutamate ligase [Geotalea daltonii]B9M170.1 RecName: Full=UDP-N-acetylmuramoylalanine--D-glutamate ligase; AltName: Full=D-glutamic acid-adding enzyme; AltName: Full=UDP-N-acetylmuramoyl-L-alanyl-D-glutamate synthetase [Geotalea daltonii FRC-32]ACM19140.1 UDP-N-acetylmuramyl-L-alanine--D-glutamate ligase [Geotalea daltonii FRC-32]